MVTIKVNRFFNIPAGRILAALVLSSLLCVFACAQQTKPVSELKAMAELIDARGHSVGTVDFLEVTAGVRIAMDLKNLPAGQHAFHIHEDGSCTTPDFKTCGGHFNPYKRKHGFLNPQGPHAGDLPNIEVGSNGKLKTELTTGLLTLRPGRANSLLKPGGTAVIIHEHPDDYLTDPAGQGGGRIACGVIKKIEE